MENPINGKTVLRFPIPDRTVSDGVDSLLLEQDIKAASMQPQYSKMQWNLQLALLAAMEIYGLIK